MRLCTSVTYPSTLWSGVYDTACLLGCILPKAPIAATVFNVQPSQGRALLVWWCLRFVEILSRKLHNGDGAVYVDETMACRRVGRVE